MKYKKEKSEHKKLAMTNIKSLFNQANYSKSPDKYVKYARKLAMKFQLTLPSDIKRRFCKHCYSYLKQGKNVSTRVHKSRIIYTCKNCSGHWRMQLK